MAAAAVAIALLAPVPALAFFQQTNLEGTIGKDIGGVWLSVQQVMPEFRLNYQKPAAGRAVPFTVGPIPADLASAMGKSAVGVVVTDCGSSTFCAEYNVLVGDVVNRVNTTDVTDVASFEKATENLPATVLLSIRRPALRMSTARLMKVKYSNEGQETQEGSVQNEKLDITVLDVKLPFADQLEASRQKHTEFKPSPADLDALRKKWFELPPNNPLQLISAQHRFVAKSNFDEPLEADKSLKDAKFALVMNMEGNPMQGGGKVIDVYGIESIGDETMDGTYVTVTMASAPFPINIEFKGRFHMTRLAPWSDEDDKLRAKQAANKAPAEDLSKFKTLPDVPAPAKPEGAKE